MNTIWSFEPTQAEKQRSNEEFDSCLGRHYGGVHIREKGSSTTFCGRVVLEGKEPKAIDKPICKKCEGELVRRMRAWREEEKARETNPERDAGEDGGGSGDSVYLRAGSRGSHHLP